MDSISITPPGVSDLLSSSSEEVPFDFRTIPFPIPIAFQTSTKLFNQLNKIFEKGQTDFIAVKDVSLQAFNDISNTCDQRGLKYRFDYEEESQLCIIKCTSDLHEVLHLGLYYNCIVDKMGANKRNWVHRGSAKFSAIIRGNRSEKQPDSSGAPRQGVPRWPTLVIEAGFSESLGYLRRDMYRWFEMSDHEVKIVLLIQWDGAQQMIILERWEEEEHPSNATRQNPTGSVLRPVLQQTITISRVGTNGNFNYVVTSGDLVLKFSLLFLREPSDGESDIVVTVGDLEDWAEVCWDYV